MIIQSLAQYYYRQYEYDPYSIAPYGWEDKEIQIILVLDMNGKLLLIEPTYEYVDTSKSKEPKGKHYFVPKDVNRAGSKPEANLLWDKLEYILGIPSIELDKITFDNFTEKITLKHKAFVDKVKIIPNSERIYSMLKFLDGLDTHNRVEIYQKIADSCPDIKKSKLKNINLTFRFSLDSDIYCQTNEGKKAVEFYINNFGNDEKNGVCMITGESTAIARTHSLIKNIGDTTGVRIVSFNNDAFDSYSKSQSYNAPVGNKTMFAYTTGLSYLLSSKSNQKLRISEDVSVVFWSESKSQLEAGFSLLFDTSVDDPSFETSKIKAILESPRRGEEYYTELNQNFYVLGLQPRSSRLSINFWITGKVIEFIDNIRIYFNDISIVKPSNDSSKYFSISRFIKSLSVGKNTPSYLVKGIFKSILKNLPFSQALYNAALLRVKNDHSRYFPPERIAIIKACINRRIREKNKDSLNTHKLKEFDMSLDKEQPSVGYQLGRLFAYLEKIQIEAHKPSKIKTTIRERYYKSASSRPATVFPTIIQLKNHHLAKFPDEKEGLKYYFEKCIGEVMSHINTFPNYLDLEGQGKFSIGYYHQMYSSNDEKGDNNGSE